MFDPIFDFDGNGKTDLPEFLIALENDPKNPLSEKNGGSDADSDD